MPLDESFKGRTGGRSRITIERSAVMNFARSLKDPNPIYYDTRAAKAAGFSNIPAPPTFIFVAGAWGIWPEDQPDDPGVNPLGEIVVEYARQGGLLLHGEQSYVYERPVVVGDVLDTEVEVVDTYSKGSMTFGIVETRFTDAATGELVVTTRTNMINRQ
jgi:acyl dehydratase